MFRFASILLALAMMAQAGGFTLALHQQQHAHGGAGHEAEHQLDGAHHASASAAERSDRKSERPAPSEPTEPECELCHLLMGGQGKIAMQHRDAHLAQPSPPQVLSHDVLPTSCFALERAQPRAPPFV